MAPMIGMMTSPTSELTMAPKAAPMMTPTARSTTLPFIANSRNSFSIAVTLPLVLPCSVDQAGMDHGAADGGAGRLGHRHHRQPQPLLQLAEQRHRIFDRRGIALHEEVHGERHQLVRQLERRRHIALLPGHMKLRAEPRRHV